MTTESSKPPSEVWVYVDSEGYACEVSEDSDFAQWKGGTSRPHVQRYIRADKAEAALGAAQAKIDALMLEYCPDEMTPEQLEEWGRRQRPVTIAADVEKP